MLEDSNTLVVCTYLELVTGSDSREITNSWNINNGDLQSEIAVVITGFYPHPFMCCTYEILLVAYWFVGQNHFISYAKLVTKSLHITMVRNMNGVCKEFAYDIVPTSMVVDKE